VTSIGSGADLSIDVRVAYVDETKVAGDITTGLPLGRVIHSIRAMVGIHRIVTIHFDVVPFERDVIQRGDGAGKSGRRCGGHLDDTSNRFSDDGYHGVPGGVNNWIPI